MNNIKKIYQSNKHLIFNRLLFNILSDNGQYDRFCQSYSSHNTSTGLIQLMLYTGIRMPTSIMNNIKK